MNILGQMMIALCVVNMIARVMKARGVCVVNAKGIDVSAKNIAALTMEDKEKIVDEAKLYGSEKVCKKYNLTSAQLGGLMGGISTRRLHKLRKICSHLQCTFREFEGRKSKSCNLCGEFIPLPFTVEKCVECNGSGYHYKYD